MEGDRRAEARPYKGMSQTKVKSRMYASKLLTERSPVAKWVMIADTYYGEMTHYGLCRLAKGGAFPVTQFDWTVNLD